MADKKERRLSDEELVEYIAHNMAMSMANATVLERQGQLEEAHGAAKVAQAKTMRYHASLVAKYHLVATEIIDEATGDIKPGPEPKKA